MTNKLLFFVLLALCFSGCDMLETHPYDVHITGERELNNKNIQLIENKMQGKKTIRFAMISDTQRWYNSTEDVVKALNARGDIDFVIHGGDQSDFGVTKEFIWMRDIFNKFQMPYVCLLGNHDCLGTGEDAYRAIYGDPNFAFTAGNVRFICLNTNAMEYDYSELDSFVIFICVEGSCRLTDDNQNEITLRAGETVLLPAAVQEVTIVPEGQRVKLLETYV